MLDFLKFNRKPLQGYKVTNAARTKKLGIAANSLKMLIEKSCEKFNIRKCKLYLAKDGNSVEDEEYFQTIEPQTLLIAACGESDIIIKSDFEILLETIKGCNAELLNAGDVAQRFIAQNHNDIVQFLNQKQHLYNSKTAKSSKVDHPEWFSSSSSSSSGGSRDTVTTKEEFMSRKSRDRIRGYFYKTKDELIKSHLYRTNKESRELFDNLLFIFSYILIGTDYFGCLFNRTHNKNNTLDTVTTDAGDQLDGQPINKKMRHTIENFVLNDNNCKLLDFNQYLVKLCNDAGDFPCQGTWDEESCQYTNHTINPYSSRENCILFQTWNLDHQIELTRSIIPALIANITKCVDKNPAEMCSVHKRNQIVNASVIDFFLKIFTIDNLKLVHIVCHDKASHDFLKKFTGKSICIACDEYKWIEQLNELIKKDC